MKSKTHKQEQDHQQRRVDAEDRSAKWNALTAEQKLSDLDYRLGKDVGAKKQRERLKSKLTVV